MYKKAIGSILMILGTSVGVGMLALPIVSAHETFSMSMLLLCFAWLLMTIGAFSVLEVNLWLPTDTNMISMAGKTLGPFGKVITWITYLLLLYSLICAYLSGLGDVIHYLFASIHIELPLWSTMLIGLLLFGIIVYKGISSVDLVNRGLMSLKFIAYFLLIGLVAKHIDIQNVTYGDYQWNHNAFMVMLTSFGYAIIVPSLRAYLENDVKLLRNVILIGSLIPLAIYALWMFAIQGIIAKSGEHGLIAMLSSTQPNSMMMHQIASVVQTTWVASIAKLFISICAVTSFLGVSICLVDFIADGLSIPKKGSSAWLVYAITYLPPLGVVLLFPGIFIAALNYAGILCLLLLIIIPISMLYAGRYQQGLQNVRFVPFGKKFLLLTMLVSLLILAVNLYHF